MTDPRDTLSQDDVLMAWEGAKNALTAAKENEMNWRKYVVKRAFPSPKEGMNNLDLGNGYTLKASVKYNYRLLENEIVEKCLDRITKIGNEGTFIADRLVSWTPNFLVTEYRALQEDDSDQAKQILAIVNEMLEITDAAPIVSISAPKVKR